MTVRDFVATEKGYWDEEAMREEARAFHTVLALSPYQKQGKQPEVADYMMPWAARHLGYRWDKEQRLRQVLANYDNILEVMLKKEKEAAPQPPIGE
jgi:hypothetical protein